MLMPFFIDVPNPENPDTPISVNLGTVESFIPINDDRTRVFMVSGNYNDLPMSYGEFWDLISGKPSLVDRIRYFLGTRVNVNPKNR